MLNPKWSNKRTSWVLLPITSSLLIVAIVLMVVGTTIGVNSPTGIGIAFAQPFISTRSFNFPINIIHSKEMSDCSEAIHLTGNLHIVTVTAMRSDGSSIVKVQ